MPMLVTSLIVVAIAVIFPLTPLGIPFEFIVPPLKFFGILAGLVGAYLVLVEILKRLFYKRYAYYLDQYA